MKNSSIFLWLIMLLSYSLGAMAKVDVYPQPQGVVASEKFKVVVQQGGEDYRSFVYYSTPLDNDAANAERIRSGVIKGINENPQLKDFYFSGNEGDLKAEQSCSYTCFSFDDEIKVQLSCPDTEINQFEILPSAYGISGVVNNGELEFTLQEPRKVAIIMNGDYLNPLFLFADALEQGIPEKDKMGTLVVRPGDNMELVKAKAKEASVVWFEPGVHPIGVAFEVFANQTIYLAGGSYLLGTLHGRMAPNVTIRGRGILAGDSISRAAVLALKKETGFKKRVAERMRYHAINMLSDQNDVSWNTYADYPGSGCDNLTIEGITIASPRQFFIRATGVPMTIYNVKMVGAWPYNTDGISTIGQANTTIYDCFFHCNDDALYVSPNYGHIHHCNFWQGNNGCVFQFSWGGAKVNQQGTYVHDCNILHCGHTEEANNRMIIGSRKSREGDVGHVHFKNISIEGPVWTLFRLETNGSGNLGSLHDITMENFIVDGPVINKSNITSSKGRKEREKSSSWIRNIALKNILINGEKLTLDDIEIGEFQVDNVTVE